MTEKDYYKILGVSREASAEEIKKAFKHLARKYHPDVNHGNKESEDEFKEANEAFQVLGDSEKRAQYDRYGSAAFSGDGNGGYSAEGFGFEDLFGDIFNVFGGRRRDYEEGADLRYDIEITLEDAFLGVKRKISIPIRETCTHCSGLGAEEKDLRTCEKCHGSGQVRVARRQGTTQFVSLSECENCQGRGKVASKHCTHCKGKGEIERIQDLEIKVPAGVDDGQYLRLEGKGGKGKNAPDGDLYVIIHVRKNDTFKREGENLFTEHTIGLETAIFGGGVEVNGIDGKKIKIKIPLGTQSHTVFKIDGDGMPHLHGKGRGDLYIKIIVEIPRPTKDKESFIKGLFK